MARIKHAWLRRAVWGAAGVLVLSLLASLTAWLALPALLKWQAEKRLTEALGRSVSIGKVEFKPWSLELTVSDLAVAAAAAPAPAGMTSAQPPLKLARLHVDIAASSVFRLAPVVEALEIDGLQLHVTRTAPGRYDIDDLIAKFTPQSNASATAPLHFALYNLQLRNARMELNDLPMARIHKIEGIHLALPFLSNLPAQVDIKVEPRLAFRLNGTPFDTGAQATPFASTRAGELKFTMTALDLVPYLGYLPDALPVRLQGGAVSADLVVRFSMPAKGAPVVALRGTAGVRNLVVTQPGGAPLLAWQHLDLGLRDVQPLARKLAFDTLRITGAQLHATRDALGHINLLELTAPEAGKSSKTPAARPVAAVAPLEWQLTLDQFDLADSQVMWNDATVKPSVALQADKLALAVTQVHWPVVAPMPVSISGTLRTQGVQGKASAAAGSFAVDGPVTMNDAKLNLTLAALSLDLLAPYLAQAVSPRVTGQVTAQARLDWSNAAGAPRLQLAVDTATVDALSLRDGKVAGRSNNNSSNNELASIRQVVLANAQVDLLARSATIGRFKLTRPVMSVARASDGSLNLQQWLVTTPARTSPSLASSARTGRPAPPWHLKFNELLLEAGHIKLADAMAVGNGHGIHRDNASDATPDPLRLDLTNLRVAVQDFVWQGERPTPPAKVQLSARVGAPSAKGDTPPRNAALLDWQGQAGAWPLQITGKLRAERFPAHLLTPYFVDATQLTLMNAEVGYNGNISVRQLPAGFDVAAAADVTLNDVKINSPINSPAATGPAGTDELLSWNALALKGVKFEMKPGVRPQLEIGEAALSDFYSRLVISEQGRINLQDMGAAPGAPAPAAAASATASATAAATATATATGTGTGTGTDANANPGLPLDIRVGITRLTNGRVDFTDHFVRPNYSVALTELNGQLGAFRSDTREMAALALRGKAAGTALLDISGLVNPTAKPLALDILARATDLELAPLSPYAGKYAGYAIERGKLTMEVAYKIGADGKLDARNQVVLNQLTFGEKVNSPDATKLPVLLAVALLKDRHGVIDINLPVSGSLDDPQFSVGGVILKVIVNLLAKAITAPFSLLSGSSGVDLSVVEFTPGTTQPTAAGIAAVDKVAQALLDRPTLKTTLTGTADAVLERAAYQAAALETRLLAERRRELQRAAADVAVAGADLPQPLGTEDRTRLLRQLYRQTEMPGKPRNAVGLLKEISAPDMEALLTTRTPVTVDTMRELALQRSLTVRDALVAKGLTSDRLFVAAPKLRQPGDAGSDANANAIWTPRAQLALSVE